MSNEKNLSTSSLIAIIQDGIATPEITRAEANERNRFTEMYANEITASVRRSFGASQVSRKSKIPKVKVVRKRSYAKEIKLLAQRFETGHKPLIFIGKTNSGREQFLNNWHITLGKDRRPYLYGCANYTMHDTRCVIFDYKLNAIYDQTFGNMHELNDDEFKEKIKDYSSSNHN